MGWKFRWFAAMLLGAATLCCLSCSNNNINQTTTTAADLYVTTAGDATLQGYVITPSSGALTLTGQGIPAACSLPPW